MSQQVSGRRRRREDEFSPGELFANGEQGAWYDPSDFATLYQDSAGTTPVTALGQPVGLMLDKSQGGKPTQELVTNGDFSNGTTGWTATNATVTVSDGVATIVDNTGTGTFETSITTVAGRTYRITYTTSATREAYVYALDSTRSVILSGPGATGTRTGTFSFVFVARDATSILLINDGSNSALTVKISAVSIREIPGNHAAQGTAAAMPYVQARVNLLERTEEIDVSPWSTASAATIPTNNGLAPDGTLTADTLQANGGDTLGRVQIAVPFTGDGEKCIAVYARAGTSTSSRFILRDNTLGVNRHDIFVTWTAGVPTLSTNAGAGTLYALESFANGWYRIKFSATNIIAANQNLLQLYADRVLGTGNVILWGAQAEDAAIPTTYQRVTTATDYADIGLPRYLEFDGVDDAMATQSVDFTGTDEMTVSAGVSSDNNSTQFIAEISANAASNNGTFGLWRASLIHNWRSKGTVDSFISGASTNSTSPLVLTGRGDISNDFAELQRDGVQDASGSGDQGTGNYGNYSLYIGARAGTSFELKGRIHQLIIRGATTAGNLLDQTERFVARKTGVAELAPYRQGSFSWDSSTSSPGAA